MRACHLDAKMNHLHKNAALFVETRVEDEIVVMSLADGDFFSIRDSARTIWELIDGTRTREDIISEVAATYATKGQLIKDEVNAFIAEIDAAGLLRAD